MKRKIKMGKKLILNKEKLNQLNDEQLGHFLGGRMGASTSYTSYTSGQSCSQDSTCITAAGCAYRL